MQGKQRFVLMSKQTMLACACWLGAAALAAAAEPVAGKTYALFDGKTLAGWKSSDFGGEGEVAVKDGAILLPVGQDMTGITWDTEKPPHKLELPRDNYELALEAMRVDGADFFCGLTFPVGEEPCSLILGGWGGGVVGLSSINGMDASENETTQYVEFDNKRWYKIRVRVAKDRIAVWLDGKEVIDVPRKDRKFGIRFEVEPSLPLGISTWQTIGAVKNLTLTKLADAPTDKKAASAPSR